MDANTYRRSFICPRCSATCHLCTSHSVKNPDRQYYKCPSEKEFIKWADQVRGNEWIDVPICSCKAGVCRVEKVSFGPDAGRVRFTCMIKEGHGSCGYSVWKDELETSATIGTAENDQSSLKSTLTNSDRGTNPTHSDLSYNQSCPSGQRLDDIDDDDLFHLIYADEIIQSLSLSASIGYDHEINLADVESPEVDDGNQNFGSFSNLISISSDNSDIDISDLIVVDEQMRTYELLEKETSCDLQCVPATSAKIKCLRSHEENRPKSSKRPLKRQRHGYLKAQTTFVSAHSFSICLDVQSASSKQYSWLTAAISQNLSPQLNGWLGRLVFRPSPCLITSSDAQFTRDLDDSIEALMSISRSTPVCISTSMIILRKPVESGPPILLTSNDSDETVRSYDNAMTKSISKVLAQAAKNLQNAFIDLLETIDDRDHRAMRQEAEATFAALDQLRFDHRDFRERVDNLIDCAKSLAEIKEESSESHQKLVDVCRSKRMRLDSFKNAQSKALGAMTKNKNRLRDLNKQVSCAKNWLFKIEAELACFEVELKALEDGFEKITEDIEVSERDYLSSCEKLEESQRIIEEREAERNAAKDAVDRARLLLRG